VSTRTIARRRLFTGAIGAAALAAVSGHGVVGAAIRQQASSPELDAASAEAELVALIGALREQHGLPPMERDAALTEMARERSRDMVARDYFSHDIPGVGQAAQWALDELPNAMEAAENLGRGNESNAVIVSRLFDAWVASPGHLRNLLRPQFNRVGIGLVETAGPGATTTKTVTQLFATAHGPLARAGGAMQAAE